MINLKKIWYLFVVALFVVTGLSSQTFAQERDRVIKTISSRPTNQPAQPQQPAVNPAQQPTVRSNSTPRPPLLQNISVAPRPEESNVTKIVSSKATGSSSIIASRSIFASVVTSAMQRSIFSKLGIPYLYGSSGPNRYDCSGFVWAVFGESGMKFTRQSARSLYSMSTPVTGDERFRFGTLVFLNRLGHMGIVADENGFYHASSSKGITYSRFKGYWENRIVGFRRLNTEALKDAPETKDSEADVADEN